ncbi:MAG: hypothetical protein ACUVV3_10835, partial [Dehalococcoidia bacterium]
GGVCLMVFEVGEAGAQEEGEEVVADLGGGAALGGIAAGELDEGVADGGEEGEGGGELAKLEGVLPVLEGVKVAGLGAGAGSFAAPSTLLRTSSG